MIDLGLNFRILLTLMFAMFAATGCLGSVGEVTHSGGHPEGHPGIDSSSWDQLEVVAPMDGFISYAIDMKGQDGYQAENMAWGLAISSASGCTRTWLFHVELTAPLKNLYLQKALIGTKITRGETLGKMMGPHLVRYLHWGVDHRDHRAGICPARTLDPEPVRCQLGAKVEEDSPKNCGKLALKDGTLMSRVR